MQYVKQEITDYVETNLTDIYPEWSPTKTYIIEYDDLNLTSNSMARYGTYYYRSLTNGNLNFSPKDFVDRNWVKYLISNKYAMLDLSAQSKSVMENDDIYVIFKQGLIKTLGVGNYEAARITIEILDTDMTTVLWSGDTIPTRAVGVDSWWTYIYAPFQDTMDKTIKIDLPIIGQFVKVTLHKNIDSNRTSCGYLVGGVAVDMGYTLKNISFSYNSFALKETDAFGALNVKKRAVQDLVDFETVIKSREIPNFRRKVKTIYNDIVMFILDESENSRYENLLTLGIIQDASLVLENDVESIMTFSIMESV